MKLLLEILLSCLLWIVFEPSRVGIVAQDRYIEVPVAAGWDTPVWSFDNRHFAFRTYNDPDDPVWNALDVFSLELSLSATWPFQPSLSDEERKKFPDADFVRASPNSQILLYQTPALDPQSYDNGYVFSLANRITGEVFRTDVDTWAQSIGSKFALYWSEQENRIAISQISASGNREFLAITIPDPADLSLTQVTYFDHSTIEDSEYYGADPFINTLLDVNADGTKVLLTANEDVSTADWYSEAVHLLLWDPVHPESSRVIDEVEDAAWISAATFSPLSEDVILYWKQNRYGSLNGMLYQYDLLSQRETPITPYEEAFNVTFSPNGEWFAFGEGTRLHIVSVRSILEEAN